MYYNQNHYNVILFQTKWRSAVKSVCLRGGMFSDLIPVLSCTDFPESSPSWNNLSLLPKSRKE